LDVYVLHAWSNCSMFIDLLKYIMYSIYSSVVIKQLSLSQRNMNVRKRGFDRALTVILCAKLVLHVTV
jgi:hypothetical protein